MVGESAGDAYMSHAGAGGRRQEDPEPARPATRKVKLNVERVDDTWYGYEVVETSNPSDGDWAWWKVETPDAPVARIEFAPGFDVQGEVRLEVTVRNGSGSDEQPHSRACGLGMHPHGPQCSSNCPTCGGRRYETQFGWSNLKPGNTY